MSAKVLRVTPFHWGHTSVELSNNTTIVITRGERVPQVGEEYPLESDIPNELELRNAVDEDETKTAESDDAVDSQASETPAVEGQSVVDEPAGQNEIGAASKSADGPREEGQQSTEAQED